MKIEIIKPTVGFITNIKECMLQFYLYLSSNDISVSFIDIIILLILFILFRYIIISISNYIKTVIPFIKKKINFIFFKFIIKIYSGYIKDIINKRLYDSIYNPIKGNIVSKLWHKDGIFQEILSDVLLHTNVIISRNIDEPFMQKFLNGESHGLQFTYDSYMKLKENNKNSSFVYLYEKYCKYHEIVLENHYTIKGYDITHIHQRKFNENYYRNNDILSNISKYIIKKIPDLYLS